MPIFLGRFGNFSDDCDNTEKIIEKKAILEIMTNNF